MTAPMQITDAMVAAAWIPTWQMMPEVEMEVAVLVILGDGTFKRDIGIYWGPGKGGGWSCNFWNDRPHVAAWCPLPPLPPPPMGK